MRNEIFYRSPGNYDVDDASNEACMDPAGYGPSLTVQSHAVDADINVLMERFKVTGQLPTSVRVPEYGDFTEIRDYRSALDAIAAMQQSFGQMPAKVRSEFSNDPQLFLEFCSNRDNLPRMRELGLAVPEVNHGGADSKSVSGVKPSEEVSSNKGG